MADAFLHHVWHYTDTDRRFWEERLEDFVPSRLIDAHVHCTDPALQLEAPSEEYRKSFWVEEVNDPQDGASLQRCYGIVYPRRKISCLHFGYPSTRYDLEAEARYTSRLCETTGWRGLVVLDPTWRVDYLHDLLELPGIIGVKPYYDLLGKTPVARNQQSESSIFAFLPCRHLELLDARGAWVTLHVPRAGRLGHPENIREIIGLRQRYPHIVLVIAHLGRCYTLAHAEEAFGPFAEDEGLFFDNSAVLNPAVHELSLKTFGPERILYGTDNPVFYMRGRRQWVGRTYVNRTDHPFHFNKEREPPEVEAGYTLYMYEALDALRWACDRLGIEREQVADIFCGNADRLMRKAEQGRKL